IVIKTNFVNLCNLSFNVNRDRGGLFQSTETEMVRHSRVLRKAVLVRECLPPNVHNMSEASRYEVHPYGFGHFRCVFLNRLVGEHFATWPDGHGASYAVAQLSSTSVDDVVAEMQMRPLELHDHLFTELTSLFTFPEALHRCHVLAGRPRN